MARRRESTQHAPVLHPPRSNHPTGRPALERHARCPQLRLHGQYRSALRPIAPRSRRPTTGRTHHHFRVLMLPQDADFLHATTNVLSNELLGGTVIYNERDQRLSPAEQIFYDIGVRLKGSFVGRDVARVGFTVDFHSDQLFRGVHDKVAVDRSQHSFIGQGEITAKQIANHAGGIPNMYDDLIHFIAPRARDTSKAQLRMAAFDEIYLDSQFRNGSDGAMYE